MRIVHVRIHTEVGLRPVKTIDLHFAATTFEYVCMSITTPNVPVTIVVVYRPGSSAPDASFFGEFTTILESLATFNSQLVILGDLNVHLEDPGDGACVTLNGILDSFSLVQQVNSPTHSAGGLLDVIIKRSDCTISNLRVDPPTISDHGLISCDIPRACPASPVFTSRRVRGWKRLDRDRFRGALSAGPLCQDEDYYDGMSASELFDVYTSTICETLDRLVPLHDIVSRFRPSTPWFDAECRSVKRGARLLERRYRRTKDPEDRLAWINALREKHIFFMSKENSYWENTVKSSSSNPKKLWRSVSTILGEPAKQTANHSTFSTAEFLAFLEQKVETISV